jgi:hypothetical protein
MRANLQTGILGLVCAAVLAAGCSDGAGGRKEITGAVTLVGQPLDDGMIVFKPAAGQDTQGGVQIVKGEYKVPSKQGLKPGKYIVQITSGDGGTPVNLPEDASPGPSKNFVSVDRVPEDWNVKSTHEVEVTADGPNKFDFEIPKLNPKYKPPK